MKALSSSIVVLSGSAIVIAAIHGAPWSRDTSWMMGIGLIVIGLAGWALSLAKEK